MSIIDIQLPPVGKLSKKKDYTFYEHEKFPLYEKKAEREYDSCAIDAVVIYEALCIRGSARFNKSIKATGYQIRLAIVVSGNELLTYSKGCNHFTDEICYVMPWGLDEHSSQKERHSDIKKLETDLGIVLDQAALKQAEEKYAHLKAHVISNMEQQQGKLTP
jgi:hypothetical protein